MAEEDMDGLLNQEDINAALEAAGLSDENADAPQESADSSSDQQESGQTSQEDINAAMEQAQASVTGGEVGSHQSVTGRCAAST